jgi:CheY-like chemotaxis protein
MVAVSDTGIGIPPEQLAAIFEMFTQLDQSLERVNVGLGVGLTLARRLTELHGGRIEARSAGLGEGSEFIVRLPVLEQAQEAVRSAGGPVAGAAVDGCRILVADDNADLATTFSTLLQFLGHQVRVATDGVAALEIARQFKPDVAFLDISMPRLNGYDVATRLSAMPETRHTMLVAITGFGQEDDQRRSREAGFHIHLVKPVEPARIESILRTLDRGRTPRTEKPA